MQQAREKFRLRLSTVTGILGRLGGLEVAIWIVLVKTAERRS